HRGHRPGALRLADEDDGGARHDAALDVLDRATHRRGGDLCGERCRAEGKRSEKHREEAEKPALHGSSSPHGRSNRPRPVEPAQRRLSILWPAFAVKGFADPNSVSWLQTLRHPASAPTPAGGRACGAALLPPSPRSRAAAG